MRHEHPVGVENEVRARGAAPALVRAVLLIVLMIAAAATAASVLAATVDLVSTLTSGTLHAVLGIDRPLPASAGSAHVVEARYGTAEVAMRDVPGGVVVLTAVSAIGGLLARLALGTGLVLLLVAVLRRVPFTPSSALSLTIAGSVAAVGALVDVGLGGLRDLMLGELLGAAASGSWPVTAIIDPTPIVLGFALMVIGLLSSHGAQLQRATDGLV